jgi:hypothetical protein
MKAKERISQDTIEQKIFLIRGQKVMLDKDLAELYGIETKVLKQAVKRNIKRFPADFMFVLIKHEFSNLRSQFVTSSWGGMRYLPMAFTEQGVAMLSSVLKSDRAIQVNIQIMRVFTRLRQMLATHKELAHKLDALEQKIIQHDGEIATIFEAIRQLMAPPDTSRKKIGFKVDKLEKPE